MYDGGERFAKVRQYSCYVYKLLRYWRS